MKPLSALSPAYRKRLQNYARKHGVSIAQARTAARGHGGASGKGATPEHPERAIRNPPKYAEYAKRRADELKAVREKKARVFPLPGSKKKYNTKRADANAAVNPQDGTGGKVNRKYMLRFLKMSDAEILDIDWSNVEWGFLFYH